MFNFLGLGPAIMQSLVQSCFSFLDFLGHVIHFYKNKLSLIFLHHWPYKNLFGKVKWKSKGVKWRWSNIHKWNWKKPKFANKVLQSPKIEWKNLQSQEIKNWTNFGTITSSRIFVFDCCISCPLNSCHCGIPNNNRKIFYLVGILTNLKKCHL